MSPQQQANNSNRAAAQQDNKKRMKSQSYRRQSAPSLVITKALTRSKTLSRESFVVSICPETSVFVQSFLNGFDRSFVLHGHAQLKTGLQTQDRHLFLFTDVLVIAKAKSSNQFKQKALVSVCEMWTAGCLEEVCEGTTSPERSFVLGWPTSNCVAVFGSAEQKEKWLSLLKSRIKEEKEDEDPKTIPLRVYGKGINTFAVTKTLPVSNSDSTNEVIRLALQQFGIIGNVKDYQLWVISKRDNTPYPLIGHEFPFSIQMNHIRYSRDGCSREGAEERLLYKQCQFILKPRPTEVIQQHEAIDFSQKSFKRRRSLIAWAFWRSPAQLTDPSLRGAPRGCLFGLPLSSVCIENTLPKPVMDMLTFLYHEGSWTRGIFRRPAGARAVRELRDTLDSGEFQLPLTRDHVFIIAGVFKEFLRSIPNSLLCCELYEEWLDALEEDDEEEEQVHDIQRILLRLPKENTMLLRHLLVVLHGIHCNSTENQMTSLNLSICFAPSLLWPPRAAHRPEVEGEGTRKICELVKFMIEHCQMIFGEDPCSMFGGPPQRQTTEEEEEEPESWQYPLTDSSYDSLENELDNSSGGSPSFTQRKIDVHHHQPLQGSLDSILAFSDYDQENDAQKPQTSSSIVRHYHIEKQGGDSVIYSSKQDFKHVDSSPSLDTRHRPRRRSEPAVTYIRKLQPYDSSIDDYDDEQPNSQSDLRDESKGQDFGFDMKYLALEASSSSLSSTPNSPAPNYSSLDSLDSLNYDKSQRQQVKRFVTDEIPVTIIATPEPEEHWAKCSPPKDVGTSKSCGNLHPNSWLKKDWRLTLSHKEHLKKKEEKTGVSDLINSNNRNSVQTKAGRRGSRDQAPEEQDRRTSLCEVKMPSPSLFYRQSGPALSLFKKQRSTEEQANPRLSQRRGSEPSRGLVDRVSSLRRSRLPSDPGLKVSEVDNKEVSMEARFCLSPNSTKAVKDYFSLHPRSNPQSSKQVALALVESQREWIKRYSEPQSEPDFEQLLSAEESYV
ncbi:rho GTPase-activating protein 20-like [Eucyclogobius newberryi]|uniref:rho GTPase-activating protein 20-like n=1 Tax=Eucyclogobius newberryi TaxID=166745 RepID=UPI003B5A355C